MVRVEKAPAGVVGDARSGRDEKASVEGGARRRRVVKAPAGLSRSGRGARRWCASRCGVQLNIVVQQRDRRCAATPSRPPSGREGARVPRSAADVASIYDHGWKMADASRGGLKDGNAGRVSVDG